jgi:ligand-binding sensor domain-containing protein/two-component sensor histidine kinase
MRYNLSFKFILICISQILLLWMLEAQALDRHKAVTQYSYDTWTTKDGLPQNSISSITQTNDGYIWTASGSGMTRFDGVRFSLIDIKEIGPSGISRLYASSDGGLWALSPSGRLIYLKDSSVSVYTVSDKPSSRDRQALFEDQSGTVWIGLSDHGLIRMHQGQNRSFTSRDGLAGNSVRAIVEDRKGNIWIGTDRGLSRIKGDDIISYKYGNSSSENLNITALALESGGGLWIGCFDGRLFKLSDNKFIPYVNDTQAEIESILEDSDGNVWVGSSLSGLNRVVDGQIGTSAAHRIFSDENIRTIFEDREKNLWLGTRRKGLVRLKTGKFTVYSKMEGLSDDLIRTVFEEADSSLWIGTRNGLNQLKNGNISIFNSLSGLPHNNVRAVYRDSQGRLWAGTQGAGLALLSGNRFSVLPSTTNIENIVSIMEDCDGTLWITSSRGNIILLSGELPQVIKASQRLPQTDVRLLYRDSKCNMWAGTADGLVLLNKGDLKTYTQKDGLPHNSVRSIKEDIEGNLWIGTHTGGLGRYKDGRFTTYTSQIGLYKDDIYQILDGHDGYLWIGCREGIYKIPKQDFYDLEQGKIKKLTSITYDDSDGMRNRECSINGKYVSVNPSSDRLMFPTIDGLVVIDPLNIQKNSIVPPVRIEEVIVDRKSLTQAGVLSIPPGQDNLEIHYTALSFSNPSRITFKYKLEGVDHDWVDAGTRRVAYYTNIPPSNYKFIVFARNEDGVWNNEGATIELRFLPYFYQTRWFYLACMVIVAALIWLLYSIRIRFIRNQFEAVLSERTRLARDLHDTLLQDLVGVTYHLQGVERMMEQTPEIKSHIKRIIDQLRQSTAEARRSILNLRSGRSSGSLKNNLSDLIASHRSPDTNVKVDFKGTVYPLPEKVEENILRIGQEAMINAFRHASASDIFITLEYNESAVRLSVRDTGRGIFENHAANKTEHFGLIGMQERAKEIGGTLNVQSQSSIGTEIILEVPRA